MILVIDNYDSFTYNLVQQIEGLGKKCEVYLNDRISISEIAKKSPEKIVISPGPGAPEDAGISNEVIRNFYKSVPILGVCLGHQCIGTFFGAKLVHADRIMHGKTSSVAFKHSRIFKDTSKIIPVARYHSLALEEVKSPLIPTAVADDGTIMALEHESLPLYGVQFHPESFLTPDGEKIIRSFLDEN